MRAALHRDGSRCDARSTASAVTGSGRRECKVGEGGVQVDGHRLPRLDVHALEAKQALERGAVLARAGWDEEAYTAAGGGLASEGGLAGKCLGVGAEHGVVCVSRKCLGSV